MYLGLKISIDPTNRDRYQLMDLARRQFDHLGPEGMKAKTGQTDRRFKKKHELRFPLRKRSQVRAVEKRIAMLGEPAIHIRRFTNPNTYPY